MGKISLLFVFFLSMDGIAQDKFMGIMPVSDGRILYTTVITVDSARKDRLFGVIKDLTVDWYKSQKAALDAEDRDQGYLAYKGYMNIPDTMDAGILRGSTYSYKLFHTIKFYVKDDKVKVVITDLVKETFIGEVSVENINYEAEKSGAKRKEKLMKMNLADVISIDSQIQKLFTYFSIKLKNAKSEFDF